MRETLFLRLRDVGPQADIAYTITVAESAASPVARHASLSQIAELTKGRRVVAFVGAADMRLTKVAVPVKQAAKALQAAPYLIEEQFAEDVEDLQFALGTRQADGGFPVAAMSRARLQRWLEQLGAAGIVPHMVTPEVLALPPPRDEAWSALAEDNQVTVRSGAYSGFSTGFDDLELMLQLADAGAEGEPRPLRLFVGNTVSHDFTGLARKVDLLPGFAHPLEMLARHYHADETINLLQGEYARRESWRRYWEPWQLAAGLTAALFVGGLVFNGIEAFRLHRAAAAQENANQQRFAQLFPAERPSPYLADQIAGLIRRAQSGGADSLFVLLQHFAEAQSATPGLTLKGIQFHDGSLFLDLTGNDLQVLEHLRSWFAAHPGARLEVPTADSTANGVQIRLKLSPA